MFKITIQKELMCPFNKCRFAFGQDEFENEVFKDMDTRCENCKMVYEKSSKIIGSQIKLDEDSKEYKEYEMLHTSICVSGNLDDDLEALQIKDINERMTCDKCYKIIIGKGCVIHDDFGGVDYNFCSKTCEDKFHESYL